MATVIRLFGRCLVKVVWLRSVNPLQTSLCRFADGLWITTDYDVRLTEIIKGSSIAGSTISVKMPGGWVTELDGVILDARARRVRKMENGKTYIMFLRNTSDSDSAFMPLRGSQGLYEIPREWVRVRHLGPARLTCRPVTTVN